MATATKLGTPRSAGINPEVKSWIDNVIVPTLVREYLADREAEKSGLLNSKIMPQCDDCKASPEGVQ